MRKTAAGIASRATAGSPNCAVLSPMDQGVSPRMIVTIRRKKCRPLGVGAVLVARCSSARIAHHEFGGKHGVRDGMIGLLQAQIGRASCRERA